MTNKEAASILEIMANNVIIPRGCGKTSVIYQNLEALVKAIEVLNNTPDKEEEEEEEDD